MKNSILKVIFSFLFLFTPYLLEAKSACKRDFFISYPQPEIRVGFSKTVKDADGLLHIVLSDGSRWTVKNKTTDTILDTIQKEWAAGDDIRIDDADEECYGEFLLKNARTKTVYVVDLEKTLDETSNAVTIVKLDQNGYAMITSDGRQWAIGWLGSFDTSKWKVGDTLLVNKSHYSSYADYALINLRNKKSVWASTVLW